MKNIILIVLVLFLSVPKLLSQNSKEKMAAYNIGLGAIAGGLGAVINKKADQKFGKVLLKGMYQGALGGSFVYYSKDLLSKLPNSMEYAWGAKIVNSMGVSIIENAALNTNFWDRYHLNIGFNRLEFNFKERFKFKYRVMPVSLVLTAYTAFGNKFELEKSLQTGEFIFSNKTVGYNSSDSRGVNYGNVIILKREKLDSPHVLMHELIHSYQYYDFNFVNAYLKRPLNKLAVKSRFYTKLNKIFYLDAHSVVLRGLYLLESNGAYSDNFFENEAYFWARQTY